MAPQRTETPAVTAGPARGTVRLRLTVAPLLVWAGLVATAAAPLAGTFDPRVGARVAIPIAFAVLAVLTGSWIAHRLRWRSLLLLAVLGAAAWAVSLALVEGSDALTAPLLSRYEYLPAVPLVGEEPGPFVDTFADRVEMFPAHVAGHPPGTVLALWALDRAGLSGAGWVAGLFIGAGATAVAAALVALREVAGEAVARRAAPFLVLAPAAVWVATSADALYLGIGAWSTTLLVLATGRSGRRRFVLALAGGLVLGFGLFFTYGAALFGFLALPVVVARRSVRALTIAAIGAFAVVAAFAAAGFWWPDGLRATAARYTAGAAGNRSYARFLVANLGAIGLACGPAAAVALARLRDRRVWLLAGGALAAVALADLSGMSKGEVERIWLPFVPWLLVSCAALAASSKGARREGFAAGRGWIGLQAVTGVLVQVVLRSPW